MVDVERFSGRGKLAFARRAYASWADIADALDIAAHERPRWPRGAEAAALWDWLADRNRLAELPWACRVAGRHDLDDLWGPMMVPVTNRVRIPRPDLHEQVVAAFRRGVEPAVAVTAAVRGTGGFGKTTLAEMVCADPEVQRAFPGGILWAEVGDAPEARMPAKVDELVRVLSAGA